MAGCSTGFAVRSRASLGDRWKRGCCFPGRREMAGHFSLRPSDVRHDRAHPRRRRVGASAQHLHSASCHVARSFPLPRRDKRRVPDREYRPGLLPRELLLEFRCLAVVFGDHSFGVRDVHQRPSGRPPVGIRMIVGNSLFNVLSMCLRARQAFLQDGDQAKGYARFFILRAKLLSSPRLQRDLALDLGDCRLCRFALCLPGVHPTPCLKPFRLNACSRRSSADGDQRVRMSSADRAPAAAMNVKPRRAGHEAARIVRDHHRSRPAARRHRNAIHPVL
jgi:hypothetical protein